MRLKQHVIGRHSNRSCDDYCRQPDGRTGEAMSGRSIHDNNIYAYAVYCGSRQIVLHTEFRDGGSEEYTDVTFTGVVAHHFECVLSGNIMFGIEEVDVEKIVRSSADLFAIQKNFGWPEGIEYRDADDLVSIIRQRGVRGYEIGSSYGLSGWVLAVRMDVSERTTRVKVIVE